MSAGIRAMTIALLALPVVAPAFILVTGGPGQWWIAALVAGGTFGVYALIWLLYRPRQFVVDAAGLTIIWPLRRRTVPPESIDTVEACDRHRLGLVLRLFGSGGLWGGFGRFWSRSIGQFDLYATRGDGLVLIHPPQGRDLVLTPDDPDSFVAALSACRRSHRPRSS